MTKRRKTPLRYVWNDTILDVEKRIYQRERLIPFDNDREIGIEIECEGHNLPRPGELPRGWQPHNDGSLRAKPEAMEYVFDVPVSRKDTMDMLDEMDAAFTKRKTTLYEDSPRTSVHVHLNQRGLPLVKVTNQVVLYTIFEEILSEYCGKHRMGNLFCLRAVDSEFVIREFANALATDNWRVIFDEHNRYAAINLAALIKFGSLEYRTMRGTRDFTAIKSWVTLLLRLKDAALKFENPQRICEQMSEVGSVAFASMIFGSSLPATNLEKRMFRGVRLAQDLAYAVSWQENPKNLPLGWASPALDEVAVEIPVWMRDGPVLGVTTAEQMLREHARVRGDWVRPAVIVPDDDDGEF